MGSVSVAS